MQIHALHGHVIGGEEIPEFALLIRGEEIQFPLYQSYTISTGDEIRGTPSSTQSFGAKVVPERHRNGEVRRRRQS